MEEQLLMLWALSYNLNLNINETINSPWGFSQGSKVYFRYYVGALYIADVIRPWAHMARRWRTITLKPLALWDRMLLLSDCLLLQLLQSWILFSCSSIFVLHVCWVQHNCFGLLSERNFPVIFQSESQHALGLLCCISWSCEQVRTTNDPPFSLLFLHATKDGRSGQPKT